MIHADVWGLCWNWRPWWGLLSMMTSGTYAGVHLPWCGHGDRHGPWAHWRPWYYGLCCHLLSWTRKHLLQWYWRLLQQHPPLPPKQSRRQPWKKICDTKAEVKLCTADGPWQGDGKDSIIYKELATGSLAMLWSIWEKQIVLGIFFLIFLFWGGVQEWKGEPRRRGRECVWGALCLKFSINKNIMLEKKNSGKGVATILNNYNAETEHMLS